MERNDALEAAIRSNRDDPAPYLVYADWLQSRGNPLGELIVLQHAGKDASAIVAGLALPEHDLAVYEWRWGLLRGVTLANARDHMAEDFDAAAVARQVFAHPACAALERLHTGVLRWDYNHVDVPAVIAEAGRHVWAASLVTLRLGDLEDVDMAHHVIGDVGAAITASFPGLRELILHSGDQSWRGEGETFAFGGLALPALRALVIETCAMTGARLDQLRGAKLPVLDKLVLWFGSRRHDADYALEEIEPTVARFPTVTRLGLCNSEDADELAAIVAGWPIAKQLVALDLSMGTMSDDGARALAAVAAAFPKLAELNVGENHLTDEGIDALRAAYPFVSADDQKEDDLSIPGEVYRYVSVHE
jgi:uncharacterized protein (TIGR02996 family)